MNRYGSLILIFGLILLGKATGFLKDLLFTFYYGVSEVTDAYFLANSISSVIYMAIFSAIPIIIVPLYSSLIAEGSQRNINRGISSAFFFFLLISAGVALFVFLTSSSLVDVFSSDMNPRIKEFASLYLSIMALTFIFSTLVAIFNSVQTVNGVSVPSYMVSVVNNIIFCVGLYFFNTVDSFYKVLMLGALSWFVLFLVNGFLTKKYLKLGLDTALAAFADKKFIFIFLPAVFSFYIEQVNGFVGVYFATELGIGAISVFGYANKLNLIFLSVFLVFLTATLFPRIAAVAARNDRQELSDYITSCVRVVIICSFPVVLYMSFYSREIVAMLFHRGKFFSDDVTKVASIFSIVMLALPFCLIRDIMNRVFFSHGNSLTPVVLSLAALVTNSFICYWFYRDYGLSSLAIALVASTILNCLIAVYFVQKKATSYIVTSSIRVLMVCLVSGSLAYSFLKISEGVSANYWQFTFFPFVIIYYVCLQVLHVHEVNMLTSRLSKILFKLI